MKITHLIIIASVVFLGLVAFAVMAYLMNMDREEHYESSVDSESPSYALDFSDGMVWAFDSIYVVGPLMLGGILLVFLVAFIILKIKKIPPKRYMFVIAAGMLLFIGLPYVSNGLMSILAIRSLESELGLIQLVGGLVTTGIGTVFIVPGIIALRKAKLRIWR